MFHALQQIGDATDKHQEAKAIVASLQNNLNRIHEQARRHSPPRVFLELWDDPLTTVGQGSFVDDIISRAGGVNVAHDISHPHPRISAEKVIAWNPDVIIVAHMAREASPTAAIAHRIGWSDIQAVRQGHVICNISTDILLRPGPRLIEGVNVLAQRFNAMDTTAQPAVYTTEQKKP
jgi:iron complex transport system substrate-binding protein